MNFRYPIAILLVGAPILGACSGTSGSTENRAYRAGESEPEWFRTAVATSHETMEVRCADFAPLEIVMTSAPLYVACIGDASMAAIAAREQVYREALERCSSEHEEHGSVSCCFSKVTDQRDLMLQEQNRCDRECAARTGAQVAKYPDRNRCHPLSVSPSRFERNRSDTAAAREVLTTCDTDRDALKRCEQLPSWVEREYCRNTCQLRLEQFGVALHQCVTLAETEGAPIRCAIRADRQEACAAACRETVRRRRTHGVEGEATGESGETRP